MIEYIGDISKADAKILAYYASFSSKILEFGCGASTQVLTGYTTGSVISIDTEQVWMDKTRANLSLLGILNDGKVTFQDYYSFMKDPWDGPFDFIFDDGADSLRREFAIQIWPQLRVGGTFAMHDTRRATDMRNIIEVIAHFQDEIGIVYFNEGHSNITCVTKKAPEPYDNWQISEKREPWQLGYGDPPESFIDSLKK